jgi:bifunctional DNA-binding transcriptional regulator/antitoxin component of YhaV-PrlF toxin-antitoxin module
VNTVVTQDGKIALPPEFRSDAQLEPGDTLDMQLYKGTIVLRKRQPLTAEQCAALLERSRSQPEPNPEDDAAVEQAIREARAQRRWS